MESAILFRANCDIVIGQQQMLSALLLLFIQRTFSWKMLYGIPVPELSSSAHDKTLQYSAAFLAPCFLLVWICFRWSIHSLTSVMLSAVLCAKCFTASSVSTPFTRFTKSLSLFWVVGYNFHFHSPVPTRYYPRGLDNGHSKKPTHLLHGGPQACFGSGMGMWMYVSGGPPLYQRGSEFGFPLTQTGCGQFLS